MADVRWSRYVSPLGCHQGYLEGWEIEEVKCPRLVKTRIGLHRLAFRKAAAGQSDCVLFLLGADV